MHESHGVARIWSELAVPVEHEMQLLGVSEALAVEYLPGPQDVQVAVPCASEKVPGEQSLHATCDTAAAAPENLPVSQSVQVSMLVAATLSECKWKYSWPRSLLSTCRQCNLCTRRYLLRLSFLSRFRPRKLRTLRCSLPRFLLSICRRCKMCMPNQTKRTFQRYSQSNRCFLLCWTYQLGKRYRQPRTM